MTSSHGRYGLHGRAAVVTGATRGIGRAVARALADAGARVCVSARDPDDVRRTAAELNGVGLAGSVADPGHPEELAGLCLREFGRLDVLVNNAATNQPYGPLMDADPALWREAFAVNVEAPLRLVQCAWRGWMREHGGAVVNICTEGAAHTGPGVGAYGTSKAALLHLTQQLAGELGPGVRVNSVSPGLVRTEMARFVWEPGERETAAALPLARIGEPEDVARAVLWLASDAAEWITGADLLVDGGTRVRRAHVAT
ncbi:SDR family oxidoreductase [Streptomyces sp. NPDC001500]